MGYAIVVHLSKYLRTKDFRLEIIEIGVKIKYELIVQIVYNISSRVRVEVFF